MNAHAPCNPGGRSQSNYCKKKKKRKEKKRLGMGYFPCPAPQT